MRLIKIATCAGILGISACSPSEGDVEAAVKAHWPHEQASAREEAAFYRDQAKAFSEGAAMSERISASLGKKSRIAEGQNEVAEESNLKADNATWISTSTVVDVSNIRCEKATEVSGHNCELDVALKGADGGQETIGAGWRFDTIDGKLAVVGSIAR